MDQEVQRQHDLLGLPVVKRFFADLSARMRRLFVCVLLCTTALTLAACGGGGGSNVGSGSTAPHEPPSSPMVRSAPLEFGYYGTWETTQVAETANHVTYAWVMAGDTGISEIQEAQMRGVKGVIVDVSWLVYVRDVKPFRVHPQGADNLRAYLTTLRDAGVLQTLSAVYPQDEPDVNGLSAQAVLKVNAMIRSVLAEFDLHVPLVVIYGTQGTPGIESYDIVGSDNYGDPEGAISRIDSIVSPTQKKLLVPGGWCADLNPIQPFLDKAESDPSVWGIAAFVWTDNAGGTTYCGIRSAPTRKSYCAAGKQIKGDTTQC
jgi:hypothetical protein